MINQCDDHIKMLLKMSKSA